jgi:hypothetical protein
VHPLVVGAGWQAGLGALALQAWQEELQAALASASVA